MRDEILELIKKNCGMIFGVDPSTLTDDTTFASLDANFVHISAALEDEYEVEVPFMQFRRNKTLGEAADYVAELLGG